MKRFLSTISEPLWFALLIVVVSLKMIHPAARRSWRRMRAEHPTGRRFVVLMRWSSKRFARSMPYLLLRILLVGAIVGALAGGTVGALSGMAAMLLLLIAVPILMPLPSSLIDGAQP